MFQAPGLTKEKREWTSKSLITSMNGKSNIESMATRVHLHIQSTNVYGQNWKI